MKANLTELVFILDRSGSMAGLETDTIGGFNAMLKKQDQAKGEAVVTTVLFDDRYEILHDRIAIKGIQAMTEADYYVRGTTALLDAVGKTIQKISHAQKKTKEAERAEKVLVIITTDGLENASKEYSHAQIKALIEKHKTNFGWEFIFLGANIDAVAEAEKFGIGADRTAQFHNDREGVSLNYDVVGEAICEMRESRALSSDWKKRIDEDYKARQ
jgi:uncharacterized protein YegL